MSALFLAACSPGTWANLMVSLEHESSGHRDHQPTRGSDLFPPSSLSRTAQLCGAAQSKEGTGFKSCLYWWIPGYLTSSAPVLCRGFGGKRELEYGVVVMTQQVARYKIHTMCWWLTWCAWWQSFGGGLSYHPTNPSASNCQGLLSWHEGEGWWSARECPGIEWSAWSFSCFTSLLPSLHSFQLLFSFILSIFP